MTQIRLYHPKYEGFCFGPNDEIKFGLRAGNEPHFAVVDDEDPLVDALLKAEPEVRVWEPAGPSTVFVCPFHPDQTFSTKAAMARHMRSAKHIDAAQEAAEE